MKRLQSFASLKPFAALIIFGFLVVPAKSSLAQPDPNPPHSYLSITETLPASGTSFVYAAPNFAASFTFSGKGTASVYQRDYEVYANLFLFENIAQYGAPPRWRSIAGGKGDHKTVTPAQGPVQFTDSEEGGAGEGSYKVRFMMEAYYTTDDGDIGAYTDPAKIGESYFSVFGAVQ